MNARPGAVLVYAVLMIALLLASALAFSSLLSGSLRQTTMVSNASEAYYLAESGAEKALWSVRKNDAILPAGDCGFGVLNKCTLSIDPESLSSLKLDLPKDQSIQFDLFNPDNNASGAGVESLFAIWTGGGSGIAEISSVEWPSGVQFTWQEYPVASVTKRIFTGNQGRDNSFAANKNYRVRVKALRADINGLQLSLNTQDNGTGTAVNFPNFLMVKSTGESGTSSQVVNVKFNRYPPMSGMFDYVLFSEAKLRK